jgi:hypothetical protein
MSVKKFPVKVLSYGRYSRWDAESKELPQVQAFTREIEAEVDVEFGYIVKIQKAKREVIHYSITHPPRRRSNGEIGSTHTGTMHIPTNDYRFFIGEYLSEPLADKIGTWRLTLRIRDQIIADESFEVLPKAEAPG